MTNYDLIVIGGGAAGITAAKWGAKFGAKVALIDKKPLGGDCLFYGCVPSKSLIKSGNVAEMMRHADRYGIEAVHPTIHFDKVINRVQGIIEEAGKFDAPEQFHKLGIDVIFGAVTFLDGEKVEVILNQDLKEIQHREFSYREGAVRLSAKRYIIATGSRPAVPPIEGLEEIGFLTNEDLFTLKKQPRSLVIVGGGPIGCEMGQAFARLGTKVTLAVRGNQIMPKEDPDVAEILYKQMQRDGVEILLQVDFKRFERTEQGNKKLVCESDGTPVEIKAEEILVATGRSPVVEGLGLEEAGVAFDTKRGIHVDKKLRTTNKRIYAVGDVNGSYPFTHAAGYEAAVAVTNAIVRYPTKVDYDSIPWTTFTEPEVAHCGLNEMEAKERGIQYEVWKADFSELDRALAESDHEGFVKILTTGKKAKIIGAQIVGPHAGELIHEFILARNKGLSLGDIAAMVHVYPTLADICRLAATPYLDRTYFSPGIKNWLKRLFGYRGK